MMRKRIAILGSTGSIGTQALEVISAHPDAFEVEILAAGNNAELLIRQSILHHPNAVVIGNEDKYLYCYNATDGKPVWKYRTNGRVVGSAVVTPSKVLFGSMDGYVYLLGLTSGKKLWSFNAGAPVSSSPAVSKGRFYILTEEGRLLAFGIK